MPNNKDRDTELRPSPEALLAGAEREEFGQQELLFEAHWQKVGNEDVLPSPHASAPPAMARVARRAQALLWHAQGRSVAEIAESSHP